MKLLKLFLKSIGMVVIVALCLASILTVILFPFLFDALGPLKSGLILLGVFLYAAALATAAQWESGKS